jgi:hypothetical protein
MSVAKAAIIELDDFSLTDRIDPLGSDARDEALKAR